MPAKETRNRRAVLAAVGTGLVATGSAIALGDDDDGQKEKAKDDSGRKTKKGKDSTRDDQQPTEPRGPVFVHDNGYFFVFLDCSRFLVFGDMRPVADVWVETISYATPESAPDDSVLIYEPESSFFFSRDVAESFPNEPAITIADSVVLNDENQQPIASATNPLSDECIPERDA